MTEPVHEARAPWRGVPDFFIVGHAKCGTTALYEMLKSHPQIYMPERKEPWFFACEHPHPRRRHGRAWTTLDQTGTRAETFEEYLSLFKATKADQRVGEASTHYLWSLTAPRRIAQARPDARIIAILREPASFLRSLHLQLSQNRHETESDFRQAIDLEDDRRAGRRIPNHSTWPACLLYSDRVRYVDQLRRYHAVFPPDQVLVLIYDDFRDDNEGSVRRVLRFLDVKDTFAVEAVEANPTVAVRSARLDTVSHAAFTGRGPVWGAVKTGVRTITPRRWRGDVGRSLRSIRERVVYSEPKPPDEDFMLELRRRFKGEIVALSEYLDRDLITLWDYDRLD